MVAARLEEYLGTCPSERIGPKIVERFKKWRETLGSSGAYSQWLRNFSQYHGGPGDGEGMETWSDAFELQGDNGEVLAIRINEMRNLITHILNLTYSKPVGLRSIAKNGDAASMQAAVISDALLEEDFREAGGTKVMRRCGEAALVVSTHFVMPEWDFDGGEEYVPEQSGEMSMTGGPRLFDLWIDEVCFDATKRDWRDVTDVVLLRRRDRWDTMSRYAPLPQEGQEDDPLSDTRDKILNAPSITASPLKGLRFAEDESDDIYTLEYLRRGGNARFLPDGRRAVVLEDGTVLDDGPNPYAGMKQLNVYPVTAAQGLGTVYGYATANDISPINRFVNMLATIMATNAAAWGSPNIAGPKLEMNDIKNLAGGGRYWGVNPQAGRVEALNLMPNLDQIAKMMQVFSSLGEKIAGVQSLLRDGAEGEMSGKAIALVKSMAVQFMSSFQQSVVEQHEAVGNCLIWLRKNFSTGKQKIAKLGTDHAQEVIEYDAGETLGKVARVRAEPIDPIMSTPEGREARADKLLEMQAFEAPWEYTTLVKTGRDEPLYKGPMSTNLLIKRENEALMQGLEAPVLKQDKHELHEVEHLCLLADPAVRRNDSLLKAVLEHNAKHTLFRMGLNVLQGEDPRTGQPYPSAIIQLEQAQMMAKQQQAQMPAQEQQPADTAAKPQGGSEQPRPPTAQESMQQRSMQPEA
jgi:hypothetical protein